MKKLILLGIFTFCIFYSGFSQLRDTVINADINPNRKMEKIELTFPADGAYNYILKVDNKEYKGVLNSNEYVYAELIDIDKSDGYTEIAIIDVGPSDGHDTYLFRFNGEIVPLGTISGMAAPETNGDGTAQAYWWMGFWGFNKKYKLDNELNRILEVTQETYPVNDVEATVTQSFDLIADRVEGTEMVASLKPGTRIKIVEADIKPVCINSAGYEDDDECDWFRVVTEDGTSGWVQLKDFRDKVDGLIWAG